MQINCLNVYLQFPVFVFFSLSLSLVVVMYNSKLKTFRNNCSSLEHYIHSFFLLLLTFILEIFLLYSILFFSFFIKIHFEFIAFRNRDFQFAQLQFLTSKQILNQTLVIKISHHKFLSAAP